MAEEYVNRIEFNNLKEEVSEIKKEMIDSEKLLSNIDKKIDIINEKLVNSDKIDTLKYDPLEKRVKALEDKNTWLTRTVGGTIIGIVIKLILDVTKVI